MRINAPDVCNRRLAMAQTVLLIGGGHVNLWVASRAGSMAALGARVVLVDPGDFWYSGLATGMLGGRYDPAGDRLDLRALVEAAGGTYLRDAVSGVLPAARRVRLGGGELSYDLLSLNAGSCVDMAAIAGAGNDPTVFAAKPVSRLWQLRQLLEAWFRAGRPPRVVVVGGGPTGVEVAANIVALAARHHAVVDASLVTSSAGLLPRAPPGAARFADRKLRAVGVGVRTGVRVTARQGEQLVTAGGEAIAADVVVLATGLIANPLAGNMGLPVAGRHGLIINQHLHSIADDRIFAGGDVAAMDGFTLPKLGVFGVRQAPVVHANLQARLRGMPLAGYVPQKRQLAILNLGDGTALATWGSRWWSGPAVMWLKDRIDRRFLAGYRATSTGLSR